MKDVLLVGFGCANAALLSGLLKRGVSVNEVKFTIINDLPTSQFPGLTPQCLCGYANPNECFTDLNRVARAIKGRFILGQLTAIDEQRRIASISDGQEIKYDFIAFGFGASLRGYLSTPGARDFALSVRAFQPVLEALDKLAAQKANNEIEKINVVVVGGGVSGCEVAVGVKSYLHETPNVEVTMINHGGAVLTATSDKFQRLGRELLEHHRVTVHNNSGVVQVARDSITVAGRTDLIGGPRTAEPFDLPANLVLWATGPEAHPIPTSIPVPVSNEGFLLTEPTGVLVGKERMTAYGDCADVKGLPWLPKNFAVVNMNQHIYTLNVLNLLEVTHKGFCGSRKVSGGGQLAPIKIPPFSPASLKTGFHSKGIYQIGPLTFHSGLLNSVTRKWIYDASWKIMSESELNKHV